MGGRFKNLVKGNQLQKRCLKCLIAEKKEKDAQRGDVMPRKSNGNLDGFIRTWFRRLGGKSTTETFLEVGPGNWNGASKKGGKRRTKTDARDSWIL